MMLIFRFSHGSEDTTAGKRTLEPLSFPEAKVLIRMVPSLFYSASASVFQYINRPENQDIKQIHLIQEIRYGMVTEKPDRFRIHQEVRSNVGIFGIIDSTCQVRPDENHYITSLSMNFSRLLGFIFASDLSTALFNNYEYIPDSTGKLKKTLSISFFTPVIWNVSAGIEYTCTDWFRFSFGITSGKLTGVLNERIYGEQHSGTVWGVEKGKKTLFEYGLSFRLVVDRTFAKTQKWTADVHLFKDYRKSVDLHLENKIILNIEKHFSIMLKTRITYEKSNSRKVQWENHLSIGVTYSF